MRNVQKNEGLSGAKAPSFTERLDARGRAHNTGVDLLRILCMFGIVAMHTVSPGWGGVFETAQPGSIQFAICALIRAVGMSALDAFALISGFVAYSEKKKPVRITGILHLYLQVLTYGLLVALVFRLVRPELVSVRHFVTPFFPITGNLYWYYTAYVGMFVVSPLLNAAIRYTPKRTLRVVLLAMFAAFSVYTAVCDSFKILEGYSTLWLITFPASTFSSFFSSISGSASPACRSFETASSFVSQITYGTIDLPSLAACTPLPLLTVSITVPYSSIYEPLFGDCSTILPACT